MLRRPVAMAVEGGHLFVANRRSGTVSVIDASSGHVIDEVDVGRMLSDIAAMPGQRMEILVLDEGRGELTRLQTRDASFQVAQRLSVGSSPVSLRVAADGRTCSIAQLWAHRITFVSLDKPLRIVGTLDLPFAPRKQWLSPDGSTLVAADAFGGNLAIIDAASRRLRGIRTIQGHNIGGIATAPGGSEVTLSHLMLDPDLSTEHEHVFWGQLMGNVLQSFRTEHLLESTPPSRLSVASAASAAMQMPAAVPLHHWKLYPVGEPNLGAGDLGDLAYAPNGTLVVALSGVNEVAMRRTSTDGFWRMPVGVDPTAVAIDPDGKHAYVANTLDDSICVIDLRLQEVSRTIALGATADLSEADRGEILFHDAKLSLDGWYSCNSCHVDGHTCGLLNDNHSDGSFNTPKRVLSLLGAADTGPWAWNGSNATLEQQIHASLTSTMQGKPDEATNEVVDALAAYVRTLKPAPSVAAARGTLDSGAIERGRKMFEAADCVHCHRPPTYTSPSAYDVNLRDEAGVRRFNPPSLRGVSQLPALLHDNRATDLRDLLTRRKHPDGQTFAPEELEDLLRFLESL
jgi:YVTN family beta-propeller protein